jgi:putative membrane protein
LRALSGVLIRLPLARVLDGGKTILDLSADATLWLKALHIIAVIAWMAGMLYLPRLFVYHSRAKPGTDTAETFKAMERRLLRAIMNPAMIATFVFGGVLLANRGSAVWTEVWVLAKLACVAGLVVMHGLMGYWRKDFEADRNPRSEKFYRIANEVPTVFMIAIVILAVVKPG